MTLGKEEIVARLGTLAQAVPETAEACELVASSLQSRWGTVLHSDAEASIDALSAARPDLPGWNLIQTMLNVGDVSTANYVSDGDYSQRDVFGTIYGPDGEPNPDALW